MVMFALPSHWDTFFQGFPAALPDLEDDERAAAVPAPDLVGVETGCWKGLAAWRAGVLGANALPGAGVAAAVMCAWSCLGSRSVKRALEGWSLGASCWGALSMARCFASRAASA